MVTVLFFKIYFLFHLKTISPKILQILNVQLKWHYVRASNTRLTIKPIAEHSMGVGIMAAKHINHHQVVWMYKVIL